MKNAQFLGWKIGRTVLSMKWQDNVNISLKVSYLDINPTNCESSDKIENFTYIMWPIIDTKLEKPLKEGLEFQKYYHHL